MDNNFMIAIYSRSPAVVSRVWRLYLFLSEKVCLQGRHHNIGEVNCRSHSMGDFDVMQL